MQWLKQSTADKPIVGPFVAATDGVTPVSFLSSDADAFLLLKQGSTTQFTLDSNALAVTSDATAFAHLTLGTTDVDVLGMLTFVAQDASLCLPVMARFMVIEAGAYGAQITGTDAAFLTASDVQAELVTYDAMKSTDGALSSDLLALNDIASSDVQAELVTYDGMKSTDGALSSDLLALNDLAATDIWDALSTDYAVATSFGAYLDAAVSGVPTSNLAASDVQAELVTYAGSTHAASDVTAGAVATSDIWDIQSSDWTAAGSFGLFLDQQISTLSLGFAATDAADVADAVWDEVTTDHVGAGTFGLNLDAQVSAAAGVPASDVWAFATRVLTTPTTDFQADLSGLNDLAASDIQAELVTYDGMKSTDGALSSDLLALNDLASSDVQAELVTYDAATGTEFATLNNLASSDIQAELVTYDAATGTEFATLNNLASSDIAAELATYDAATGTELAALNDLADSDVLGYTLETGYTVEQSLKLIGSALAGKSSGGGTATIIFRDLADGANRITATVDTDGNRTAVTLNP